MKAQLKKLKAKMPAAPSKEEDDMLDLNLEEGEEPEEGETKEHEAAESPEFEAGEHEEASEESGLPEGTPEEEAMETEEKHTSELSDEALLAEVEKRGLKIGKPLPKKAVAVSKDVEEETGY